MRSADGYEVLVILAVPLPVAVVSELARAIGKAAKRLGYTDVALRTDGTYQIIAKPPARQR